MEPNSKHITKVSFPIVSVIIPIYNAEQFLSRCIDSVLNQSYQSLEIVLMDDGSTDNSIGICDAYEHAFSSIKVYHIPNGGASHARKKGIELCSGEYITFVDSDDIVEPEYVEKLLFALQQQKTPIAACNIIKHYENEEDIHISKEGDLHLLEKKELHVRFFKYEFWGFWGKIYSKSVFDSIYFPTATINEDYVVMAQLFHKYQRIAYIDASLYHYMIHRESLSNQKLSSRMMEEWTNKLWCYHFYRENAKEWEKYAEAQVAETCCKLIAAIGNVKEYNKQKCEMQQFLRKNYISLLCNKHLVWGLKLILVQRIVF